MFYILVFLVLSYLSYCEFKGKTYRIFSFNMVFAFVTFLAVIRYGQGTDYFGYMYNYYMTPPLKSFTSVFGLDVHGEIGFTFIYSIFRTFNIRFEFFVGLIGLLTMLLIYRFIKKYSKLPITSLTMFYVLYYLVYVFSGIRQGLAIAIFVGIGIDLYKSKKYKEFIFLVLLTATIHSSIIITLLVFAVDKVKLSYKFYGALTIIALLIMVTNLDMTLINLLPGFLSNKILSYWGDGGISILAFANRAVFLFLILFYSFGKSESEDMLFFKKLYILSFLLYILTIKSMTISSRISLYFKVFEIVLVPNIAMMLAKQSKNFKAVQLWGISMAIVAVLLIKTLNAFISEGDYFDNVSVINYPYISVFNKGVIWDLRGTNHYFNLVDILFRSGQLKH